MKEIIALEKFTAKRGQEYPIHSMTAAYNVQTKEARIYAECERVSESTIEAVLESMGGKTVKVITFSPTNWETESARSLRSVLDCEGKNGFSLHRSVNAPSAAISMGNTTGISSTDDSALLDGAACACDGEKESYDEEEPGTSSQERNKRRREGSPGGMDASSVDFMKSVFNDSVRKSEEVFSLREAVSNARHEREMSQLTAQMMELSSKLAAKEGEVEEKTRLVNTLNDDMRRMKVGVFLLGIVWCY
jgi:hypothetical protein